MGCSGRSGGRGSDSTGAGHSPGQRPYRRMRRSQGRERRSHFEHFGPSGHYKGRKGGTKAPGRAAVGPSQSSPQIPVSPVVVPDTVKQK